MKPTREDVQQTSAREELTASISCMLSFDARRRVGHHHASPEVSPRGPSVKVLDITKLKSLRRCYTAVGSIPGSWKACLLAGSKLQTAARRTEEFTLPVN